MDKSKRIPILDVIRGTCILLMIIYHSSYSIMAFGFFKKAKWLYGLFDFYTTPFYTVIWLITLCCFFGIAGIVSNFSRSNFKRCVPVIVVAVVITVITVLFIPDEAIYFGVLHCMGACMLIYAFIEKFCKKFFDKIHASIFLILFAIFYIITETVPPVGSVVISIMGHGFELPLFILGFYSKNFFSADYYPIIPWLFLFLAGVKAGELIKNERLPMGFYKVNVKFLSFIGRHPLIIYATHVPIIVLIFYLLNMIISK